jgi:hypothetical protein
MSTVPKQDCQQTDHLSTTPGPDDAIYYILPIMSCNLIVACLIEMDNKLKSIVSPRPTHLPGRRYTISSQSCPASNYTPEFMPRGGDFKVQDGK